MQDPPDTTDPSSPAPGRRARRWRRVGGELAVVIVLGVLGSVVVRAFVFQIYAVPSPSMVPTIDVGDQMIVNKLGFDYHQLQQGAVVVFRRPAADRSGVCAPPLEADLVKRVIGLPGQTVSSRNSTVLVDGRPLAEPYLAAGTALGRPIRPAVHVAPNHYFVLGDNRALSCDSRYWGTITGSSIIGQVAAVIWRHGHPELRRI